MKLMIVESPTKCKKISGYLGQGWVVKASVGHVRDLPKKELGVDPDNRFRPSYVVSEDKQRVVRDLQTAAKNAEEIWLAMDPDREGEAIAYHLRTVLGLGDNYQRVTFSEITKAAITASLAKARKLDTSQIAAQETRRILDRLFGYLVSPALQQQTDISMSAGRVQSPTVGLVVDRERSIQNFEERRHYGAEITLENGLVLKLDSKPYKNDEGLILEAGIIDALLSSIDVVTVVLSESTEKHVRPKPPFTTSDLQQTASSKLGLSPDQTMKLAQKLFEAGRITYHRTDDPNLSDEGWKLVENYLVDEGIAVSDQRRKWKAKDTNAQEAHEGIRPTAMTDQAASDEPTEKLYRMIWERTVASVAADGIDLVSRVVVVPVGESKPEFKVSGKVLRDSGWRDLLTVETASTDDNELPVLPPAESKHKVVERVRLDLVTKPPSRFTEATLVKELEKRGIGRPSTYASIFANVFRRGYLELAKGRQIHPTPLGSAVRDALSDLQFMDYEYTAELEHQLDQIAKRELKLLDVVEPAYKQLLSDLPKVQLDKSLVNEFAQSNTEPCPRCSQPLKRLAKKDSNQFFWVHVSESNCDQFIEDVNGRPYVSDLAEHRCPLCGDLLKREYSKKSSKHFWAHATKEACAKMFYDDRSGKPVLDALLCPKCKKPIKRLASKKGKGHFWVHIDGAGDCVAYIDDKRGKPLFS